MNELIPVHDRDRPLVAELDTEMVDWYVSNMPPTRSGYIKKPWTKSTHGSLGYRQRCHARSVYQTVASYPR